MSGDADGSNRPDAEVHRLLDELLALRPELRRRLLENLAPGDTGVVPPPVEPDTAPGSARETDGFGGTIPRGSGGHLLEQTSATRSSAGGEMIGPFRLLELIGSGGMGEVWLAEQIEPVRRRVALKVIKAGMDTTEVIARFESERQALALMDHPAIAKVLDAGKTPEGRPYFAMEYVAGIPLDRYCREHKLDTRERLELFVQVCEGVQHAHQKAILHRDLKPANVLVATIDDRPQAKIIDFGIAKATGQRLTDKTLFTQLGAFIGTPEYMSPEQAALTGQDVDTRTDVYSLGVILYELLTGSLPFPADDLRGGGIDELRRKIRETDPPTPSVRVSTLLRGDPKKLPPVQPAALARQLKGDLDAITMKALEKDRRRRYGSPSDLAADIQRHLEHRAVLARPASTTYRVSRYVRRHRLGVAIAAGLFLLLLGFGISTSLQARRIAREAATSQRVSSFLTQVFKISNPSESRANSVTARELLDKASADAEATLKEEPEVHARMLEVMGDAYRGLGAMATARSKYDETLALWKQVNGGRPNATTVNVAGNLAYTLYRLGKYDEAERTAKQAVADGEQVLKPEAPELLWALSSLAVVESAFGRNDEAIAVFRRIATARVRAQGPEHKDTLRARYNLAVALSQAHQFPESEKILRELQPIQARVLGPDSPEAATLAATLAHALNGQKKYAEGIAEMKRALDIATRSLGPDHPTTLTIMNNLGDDCVTAGQFAEGERYLRQALAGREKVIGPDHPWTFTTRLALASALLNQGKAQEVPPLILPWLDAAKAKIPAADPSLNIAYENLAVAALKTGQTGQAYEWLGKAVEAGYSTSDLKTDDDFASIRNEPRFVALVSSPPVQPKP
jgi:eukaryotic-like serine/threonine-protein kinase